MNSSQLIKKRLVQLKKMSVQLKESTENHNQVDYSLIQDILSATKSSTLSENTNDHMYFSKTSKRSDRDKQSPLAKLLSFTVPHNPHDNINSAQQYTTLFPQNNHYAKKQSKRALFQSKSNNSIQHKPFEQGGVHSHQAYFSKQQDSRNFNYRNQSFKSYQNQQQIQMLNHNSNEHQIISLRQQNTELQKKLMHLRKQVDNLKEKNQKLEQQTWKEGLPFFKLEEKIQGFYTKLRVSEKDYQKIDYTTYQCNLTLDKFLITKATGSPSPKELYLASMLSVYYIQSTIMLLQFGQANDQDYQNLFIKFQNQQDLHRWDIALYINFQIIDSLKKQKLFNASNYNINLKGKQRKKSAQSRKRSSDSHKKSSEQYKDQKDLIHKLVQTRDMYLQTKKLVSQKMIQKINAKKAKKQQKGDQMQANQQSQTTPYQAKDNSLNRNLFDAFLNSKSEDQQGKQFQEKQKRTNTSKFRQLHEIPPLAIGDNMSFNSNGFQLNINKKLQQEKQKQRKKEELQNLQREKEEKKIFNEILNRMTKIGYRLTKYSKDGFNPHNKRVYVQQNLQNLCWEQESGGDLKKVALSNIKQVVYQKIGEGVRKHVKKPKKQEYCIINYVTDDKKNKTIQLGGDADQTSKFVDELILLMQHRNKQKK